MLTCSICKHPKRAAIDTALAAGTPLRDVAGQHSVSKSALFRHRVHAGQAIQKAAERPGERIGDSTLDGLEAIQRKLWALLERMEREGDSRGAVVACRENRETLAAVDATLARAKAARASSLPDIAAVQAKLRRELGLPPVERLVPGRRKLPVPGLSIGVHAMRIVGVLVAAITLAACGGSPSAPANQPLPAVVVSGAYAGTYTIQGGSPVSAIGAVDDNGGGFFLDSAGTFWLLPAFTSSGAASGALNWVPPPGQSTNGLAEPAYTITLTASGNPADLITGTASDSAGSAAISLSTLPTQTVTLADLAGSYIGLVADAPAQPTLTISATGQISGSAWGCPLSGTITVVSGSLLTVSLTDGTLDAGNVCIGPAAGLGFVATQDFLGAAKLTQQGVPGPYLYLGASNSTNGILLELAKQ